MVYFMIPFTWVKLWKCLKYCDSVTRDFQDAIEKNQFFVVNDPDFSGFESDIDYDWYKEQAGLMLNKILPAFVV